MTETTKPLIAIVDDDDSVCRAIKRLVRSAGMEARSFSSGEEFLQLMARTSIACIVLDVHMPGMNGLDVQARLAENGSSVPVMFITAHDEPSVRQRALRAGAVAVFSKPFDNEVFIKAVGEAINNGGVKISP